MVEEKRRKKAFGSRFWPSRRCREATHESALPRRKRLSTRFFVFTDTDGDGTHDAGESTLAEYTYDALGRRIQSVMHDGASATTTRYVYDGQRVIAEYNENMQLQRYFIDGNTYIDEHLAMVDVTGQQPREYYYLLKDLYTVAGLVDETGKVVEGYGYDAYGKVRMYQIMGDVADADRDGDVDINDFESLQRCFSGDGNTIPAGCSAEEITRLDVDGDADIDELDMNVFMACWQGPAWAIRATGDYDEDGDVTLLDVAEFVSCTEKSLPQDPQCSAFDFDGDSEIGLYDYAILASLVGQPAGTPWGGCYVAQSTSQVGNPYFFTGRRLDLIAASSTQELSQLYHYRARWYDPAHGRFGQRDPLGHAESCRSVPEVAGNNDTPGGYNLLEYA
ncbi:MAG TPA: hypothetical protein P5572_00855, partial [Phycisphaerae bacterium]|nr:hypothetical protein [Phycisphaerae bacterium]